MDTAIRDKFLALWAKFFNGAALPICLYYSDEETYRQFLRPGKGHACIIGQLEIARKGETLAYDKDSICCHGGRRYLGFEGEAPPNFEYFLSYGIPGKLEGERYKKSPELVRQVMAQSARFEAPARFAVFKRWDKLAAADEPQVVIFFAEPDVLSGLFTLSNFDESDPNSVIAPFAAGCGTIVQQPYLENQSDRPRSVIGMLDVSARPCVKSSVVSFAAPMRKFVRMVDNMEESFLVTPSWGKVRRRIGSAS